MDLVASYLQRHRGHQDFFLGRSGSSSRNENNNENNNEIVSAAVSSMVDGAAAALRSSRRSVERNVEEARAVTAFALSSPSSSSSSSPFPSAGAPFAALIPGNSPAEIVFTSGISSFLSLYNAAIVGRLLLSWWPQAPQAVVSPLATLTDPYLGLFRGIIPPLGGTLDLSPILAFVTLDLFTNAAAALPCEMPPAATADDAAAAARGKGRRSGNAAVVGGPRIPPRPTRWRVPSLVAAARKRRSE